MCDLATSKVDDRAMTLRALACLSRLVRTLQDTSVVVEVVSPSEHSFSRAHMPKEATGSDSQAQALTAPA